MRRDKRLVKALVLAALARSLALALWLVATTALVASALAPEARDTCGAAARPALPLVVMMALAACSAGLHGAGAVAVPAPCRGAGAAARAGACAARDRRRRRR